MTGAAQGDQVGVLHGITGTKIISITGVIFHGNGNTVPIGSKQAGYASYCATTPNQFFITNELNNSSGLLLKNFRAVIEYIA